jgi:hypothetical protein
MVARDARPPQGNPAQGNLFVAKLGPEAVATFPTRKLKQGDLLSHASYRDGAYLILAGVSLGQFWPSYPEGPLVYF